MQERFGFKQVETSGQADLVIGALMGKRPQYDRELKKGRLAPRPAAAHGRRCANVPKDARRGRTERPKIPGPEQPATAEQLATIERLSGMIKWHDDFSEWLQKVFGLERVELYGQAEKVVAALRDKLRIRSERGPEQSATAEQLAAIERLSHAIRWNRSFEAWLQTKCGLERIALYGQAEEAIAGLRNLFVEQMKRPRGAVLPDECAMPPLSRGNL
jgi:hypothetical protein